MLGFALFYFGSAGDWTQDPGPCMFRKHCSYWVTSQTLCAFIFCCFIVTLCDPECVKAYVGTFFPHLPDEFPCHWKSLSLACLSSPVHYPLPSWPKFRKTNKLHSCCNIQNQAEMKAWSSHLISLKTKRSRGIGSPVNRCEVSQIQKYWLRLGL